jgi:retron-type reverse transcriptase
MTKPTISLQELRAKIGQRAKSAPAHRFWGLHVHIMKLDTLEAAYLEAKRNGGAPGSDAETFEVIEGQGREEFLAKLAEELRTDAYHPRPYRRREIPKEGGKVRVISIPAIRDRVVQGALRLILEPIFEAGLGEHLSPGSRLQSIAGGVPVVGREVGVEQGGQGGIVAHQVLAGVDRQAGICAEPRQGAD